MSHCQLVAQPQGRGQLVVEPLGRMCQFWLNDLITHDVVKCGTPLSPNYNQCFKICVERLIGGMTQNAPGEMSGPHRKGCIPSYHDLVLMFTCIYEPIPAGIPYMFWSCCFFVAAMQRKWSTK